MTRLLAISAHPDDAELGAGGLIQRADERRIVVLSRGEAGGDAAQRVAEQGAAARTLGASVVVHDLHDTKVGLRDAIAVLEQEIRTYGPDVVVTMSHNDAHQDHRTAYRATMVACRDVSCTILAYVGPSSAPRFQPNWFLLLDEHEMRMKLAALACYQSQGARAYMAPDSIKGMASYWAMVERCGGPYVEPFELVRHIER